MRATSCGILNGHSGIKADWMVSVTVDLGKIVHRLSTAVIADDMTGCVGGA